MRLSYLKKLPYDIWMMITHHLNSSDALKLFWALWQEKIFEFDDVVQAFNKFTLIKLTVIKENP